MRNFACIAPKRTNVKISFRCNNTITRLTKPSNVHKIPPHNKWEIYQLTCNSCNLSYVGQTIRRLKIRYQEHIRYMRSNNPLSSYAQHILRNQQSVACSWFLLYAYVTMHGQTYIKLTVSSLSTLRFVTRTETKQIRKGSKNSRPYKLRKFLRCNLEEEEYECERKTERSVGGVWADVSFWTRAPIVRIYKPHTEFSTDK